MPAAQGRKRAPKGGFSLVWCACGGAHTGGVSMYVTILSGALDLWDTDLDGRCSARLRARLPRRSARAGPRRRRVVRDDPGRRGRLRPRARLPGRPIRHRRDADELRPSRESSGTASSWNWSRRGVDLEGPTRPTERCRGRLALVLELGGVDGGLGSTRHLELAQQARSHSSSPCSPSRNIASAICLLVLPSAMRSKMRASWGERDEARRISLAAGWRCVRPPGPRPSDPSATPPSPPSSRLRSGHGP